MDTYPSPADEALVKLREDFPSHRIWRSVHPDGRLDGWVASLHDPAGGVEPLVIRANADELRTALVAERRRAEQRSVMAQDHTTTARPASSATHISPEAESS